MNPAFGGFYQSAYITNDLDRAIELYRTTYGVPEFLTLDADYEVDYRGAAGRLNLRIALVNLNGVQIELIQPRQDCIDMYSEGLPPAAFAIRHHHLAVRVEGDEARWDAWRSQLEQGGRKVAMEASMGFARFLYVDDRPLVGHYTEYFWSTDEQRRRFDAAIPSFQQTT